MKNSLAFALCVSIGLASLSCNTTRNTLQGEENVKPLPLPKAIRIDSAGPRSKVWDRLTEKQKGLAASLFKAGQLGRVLLYHQAHRHALAVREVLAKSLSRNEIAETKRYLGPEGFNEYLRYSAKFFDQMGPYSSSNRKYILQLVTPGQARELIKHYLPNHEERIREEIVKLLTHPSYETLQFPEDPDGGDLEITGGNIYERGIRGEEVRKAIEAKTLKLDLNCRIVRTANGGLSCERQTVMTPGVVGSTLREIVVELEKALAFAATDFQRQQIAATVKYFTTGDVEEFRNANIAWVKDRNNSVIDHMIGWVEVYEDWQAKIGTWESYVQAIDPEVSKLAENLAHFAQYFEDGMPYGTFKKKFPADYSPPAIMVYYMQEIASYRSGGYNLPNFDDIRNKVGAKNVIRLPMPGEDDDPAIQNITREMLEMFAPANKIEDLLAAKTKSRQALVLMHEIIGHGSGTYDESKYDKNQDPISGLGNLGSALEEQRADLAALVYAGDSKWIDVGHYKDADEALKIRNLTYDYYLIDFLRRTAGQRTFVEAHQRGHLLFINKLLEAGAIHWVDKKTLKPESPEKGILAVKDYDLFHKVSKDLLGELQDIKANRKQDKLRELFANYASVDDIKKPWAEAIVERGKDLLVNAGYVEQPWRVGMGGNLEAFGELNLESIAPYWSELGS